MSLLIIDYQGLKARLHPQGKGGPEATFCVRDACVVSSYVSAKSDYRLPQIAKNSLICGKCARDAEDGRTEVGRTNRIFYEPPYTKSPFGAKKYPNILVQKMMKMIEKCASRHLPCRVLSSQYIIDLYLDRHSRYTPPPTPPQGPSILKTPGNERFTTNSCGLK